MSDFGTKPSIGKTGVHLRYHTGPEYKELSKAQQDELRAWRLENPAKKRAGANARAGGGGGRADKRPKSQIKAMAAAIKKGVDESLAKRQEQATSEEESKAYLMSLVTAAVGEALGKKPAPGATSGSTTASPSASLLKGILKKAKQG